MSFVYLTFLAFTFLLIPDSAFAWGPGTHLDIAVTVLQNAAWCLPTIWKLIHAYPNEFIYGSVAPDIIFAKKYSGSLHHCHNWSIGRLILEEAKSDEEKAAAWGYLTHLAADCVAHNYLVPFKIIESFKHRALGHPYWEMRFDLHVPEKIWRELHHVIQKNYRPFDHLLSRVLQKTLFSFKTNKKIFNSILVLHRMKQLRFGLKTYAKASRWEVTKEEREHYRGLSLRIVREFLTDPGKAKCLKADPVGAIKLAYAIELGRALRRFVRREGSSLVVTKFIRTVQEKLHQNLFDNTAVLPGLEKIL